ncbi:MAG: hypothetical protein M3H12_14920, partial [Chromatiales bacterium]
HHHAHHLYLRFMPYFNPITHVEQRGTINTFCSLIRVISSVLRRVIVRKAGNLLLHHPREKIGELI